MSPPIAPAVPPFFKSCSFSQRLCEFRKTGLAFEDCGLSDMVNRSEGSLVESGHWSADTLLCTIPRPAGSVAPDTCRGKPHVRKSNVTCTKVYGGERTFG